MKQIFSELRTKSRLSASTKRQLFETYLGYLQQRGGKDAMKQFLLIDRQIFGYVAPRVIGALEDVLTLISPASVAGVKTGFKDESVNP